MLKRLAVAAAFVLVACNDPQANPTGPSDDIVVLPHPLYLYSATEVGLMPGGTFSTATAINSAGTIVGQADHCTALLFNGHLVSLCSTTGYYKTSGGTMKAIPMLPGHVTATATGITDAGIIVGWSRPSGGFPVPSGWFYDPATNHLESIPSISGGGVVANAAASNGWVTGTRTNGVTLAPTAFRFSVNTHFLEDLTPAGFAGSEGYAIDVVGDVGGMVYTATAGVTHGFAWYGGGSTQDLTALESSVPYATAINGVVVGPFKPYDGVTPRVFSYMIGGSLGDIGAGINRYPTAISSLGRLVGYGTTSTHTPFTFYNTVSSSLPTVNALHDVAPAALNRCGTIVGTGYDAAWRTHAIVWSKLSCD